MIITKSYCIAFEAPHFSQVVHKFSESSDFKQQKLVFYNVKKRDNLQWVTICGDRHDQIDSMGLTG